MKGDFSRDSFNRLKHFRRVLMQQGRVQIDADWNEQVSILLHYMQTLAMDIIGPYAGPENNCGFEITANENPTDFTIGKGRYYVNGILCENDIDGISYLTQPNFPKPRALRNKSKKNYVVYLDVWERHITFLEDDDIREKALGGPDTATRTETVWQVRVKELVLPPNDDNYCLIGAGLLDNEIVISKACLRAYAKKDRQQFEPCLVEPEAKYRGTENQLYRVEVHEGGSINQEKPTFKWSRENGAVAFPIKGIKSNGNDTVTLELVTLGPDDKFGLQVNDWVEIEDNAYIFKNKARPLLQVQKVDRFEKTVILSNKNGKTYKIDLKTSALLRRWDQKKDVDDNGVLKIAESDDLVKGWIEIENGIKIQFHPGGTYRTGDYWLIPARTAIGDVEWPKEVDNGDFKPNFLPPRGVMHHLAPLAIISVSQSEITVTHDCRCSFRPLSYNCLYNYYGQLGIGTDLLCSARND